jgi:hypothetical protein
MELRDFIQAELDRVKQATMRTLDGLSQQEVSWHPNPDTNSIGLILFHQARYEDMMIQSRLQSKTQVWEAEKWYETLNLPASETGSGYTAEQCAAFRVPELKDLMAYAEAVRSHTVEYLKTTTPEAFDKRINMPRFSDVPLGSVFALLLVHMAQHAGEISYLRGLKRGMNK